MRSRTRENGKRALDRCARRLMVAVPCLLAASRVVAQGPARQGVPTVHGRVLDAQTNVPIPRVSVVAVRGVDTLGVGWSDSAGSFALHVRTDGALALHLRRLGYRPVVKIVGASEAGVGLELSLLAIPRALEEVAVLEHARPTGRLAGFEDRAAHRHGGTFITRENLDAWHSSRTSDALRRVLGVKLLDSAGVLLVVSTRGTKAVFRKGVIDLAPCFLRVGIDGQVKEWGFSVNEIDPNHIHGIEVYNGPATLPAEFNGLRTDSYCGLVMIWTRSGS